MFFCVVCIDFCVCFCWCVIDCRVMIWLEMFFRVCESRVL